MGLVGMSTHPPFCGAGQIPNSKFSPLYRALRNHHKPDKCCVGDVAKVICLFCVHLADFIGSIISVALKWRSAVVDLRTFTFSEVCVRFVVSANNS